MYILAALTLFALWVLICYSAGLLIGWSIDKGAKKVVGEPRKEDNKKVETFYILYIHDSGDMYYVESLKRAEEVKNGLKSKGMAPEDVMLIEKEYRRGGSLQRSIPFSFEW